VASNVPGVAEIVPGGEADGGLTVPPGEPAPLAAALRRLIDDVELARRLGDAGRRRIEREYSLQVVGPKLQRFLFPGVRREN
jgi:glycosyltransferase involved in cell wall biosynthesis